MVLAGHARIIRTVAGCAKILVVIDSDSSRRHPAKSAGYRCSSPDADKAVHAPKSSPDGGNSLCFGNAR